MADLMQITESGYRNPGETGIRWCESWRHPADSANRRRIIDREADNGFAPGADGWLHTWREIVSDGETFEHHIRIRWEDMRWYAEEDRHG